ncbi:MAG: Type 1 glutamine amidotransferase-like domain-containing protein [Enterococcus sp.]|nr:Type 1 glutamine amidotransferase-like domain-containing protein [Enterococcus sp.]
MMTMFLASSFSDVEAKFDAYLKQFSYNKSVTFIPTASFVEEVDFYVEEALEVFKRLQFTIDVVDISSESPEVIAHTLQKNEVIYISGGNTFYLLEQLYRSGTFAVLIEQIKAGKMYIGESAGAVITSAAIDYISPLDDRSKASSLQSTQGLNVIPYYPLPHYKEEPFAEITTTIVESNQDKKDLIPLKNDEVLLVNGTTFEVI